MHCNDKCEILYYADFSLMVVKILDFISLSTVFTYFMRTNYPKISYHQQLAYLLFK